MSDVAIIGGGPAGVFCAIKLLEYCPDIKITVFDKTDLLTTILPTGGGRCNLAYNEYNYKELASYYPRGEKFLYSIFARYGLDKTLSDFDKIGINTYVQDDNRIFPTSNSSSEFRKILLSKIKKINFIKKKIDNLPFGYKYYVLATGLKYGAGLAQKIGHKIIDLKPALCGLNIKEKEFLSLAGVSFGDILFTHFGISGPYIYKLTSYNAYKKFPYFVEIPLCKYDDLQKIVKDNPKKLLRNVFSEFVPKSLAQILIKDDIQCANTPKERLESLTVLKLTALSTDGKGEIVHAGGVSLDEIDKNLKSKIKDNVWIIGELLNIDGLTGGFNLQNCWSTAAIAAQNIAEEIYS